MKRLIYLIILVCFCININVYAEEYQVKTLIPVNTAATVNTEKFTYNFVYDSNLDLKGNNYINFSSIKNNKLSKSAVSINILLFDSNNKNIGLVTYCSDKDINSDYAGFKLEGNQESPFSIKVTRKYLVNDKALTDVAFIAVLDENKYCQIGGYDKYNGLTIEEITNGNLGKGNGGIFSNLIANKELIKLLITIIIGLTLYVTYGMTLNYLYKRMYGKETFLVYVPFANIFISVKMALGGIVSKVFIGFYIVSFLLYLINIKILFSIANILSIIVFILIIIKIITKKYDLFYLEPKIKQEQTENDISTLNDNNSVGVNPTNTSSEAPIDLNYETSDVVEELKDEPVTENENTEVEEEKPNEEMKALDEDELYDLDSYDDNNSDEDDGEKDISDYFK